MIRAYTHAEIDGLNCARRSGIEPTADVVDRLMATVEVLRRELVQANSRAGNGLAPSLPGVPALIALLELRDVAEETLSHPGPMTYVPGPQVGPFCVSCGAAIDSGECCLDPIRAVLRTLPKEGPPCP